MPCIWRKNGEEWIKTDLFQSTWAQTEESTVTGVRVGILIGHFPYAPGRAAGMPLAAGVDRRSHIVAARMRPEFRPYHSNFAEKRPGRSSNPGPALHNTAGVVSASRAGGGVRQNVVR